jgi:hypothetical protein
VESLCIACKAPVQDSELYCAGCTTDQSEKKTRAATTTLNVTRVIISLGLIGGAGILGVVISVLIFMLYGYTFFFAEGYAGHNSASLEWLLWLCGIILSILVLGAVSIAGLFWMPANPYRRIVFMLSLTALGLACIGGICLLLILGFWK